MPGPVPGNTFDIYENIFNKKLKQLLNKTQIQESANISFESCNLKSDCQKLFFGAKGFTLTMDYLYPRPFPKLGALISIFEDKIFPNHKLNLRPAQEQLYNLLSYMLTDYYHQQVELTPLTDLASWGSYQSIGGYSKPNYTLHYSGCKIQEFKELYAQLMSFVDFKGETLPCSDKQSPCCNHSQTLIKDNFEFFLQYMKHSYLSSNHFNNKKETFFSDLVKNLTIWKQLPLSSTSPEHRLDSKANEMILFCNFIPDLSEAKNLKLDCDRFKPVSTCPGLCFSYNSLHPSKIFRPSPFFDMWNKVFQIDPEVLLDYSPGYGPSKGKQTRCNKNMC